VKMTQLLASDLKAGSRLFIVSGPIDAEVLRAWVSGYGRPVPEGLLALWGMIGGGTIFETEDILVPGGTGDYDIDAINAEFREWRALAPDLLVFHAGGEVTAIDERGAVVGLDSTSLVPVRSFASIEDWYRELRDVFAAKYGLPPS